MVFMSRSTRPVRTNNRVNIGPLTKRHQNGVSLLWQVDSGPRLDDGWAKVQPAVVLILKRLRILLFVAVFLGYNQYWPGGFMGFQEHLMLYRQWFWF